MWYAALNRFSIVGNVADVDVSPLWFFCTPPGQESDPVGVIGVLACAGGETQIRCSVTVRDGLPAYLIASRSSDMSTHDIVQGPFSASTITRISVTPGTWYLQMSRFAMVGNKQRVDVPFGYCPR